MLNIQKLLMRYEIQRKVAISCAVAVFSIAVVNFFTGLFFFGFTLIEAVSHPTILVLVALAIFCSVTALKDWAVFRIGHTCVFLGFPIFQIVMLETTPRDISGLIWGIYGIILGIQYGLLVRHFWMKTSFYLAILFLAKIYSAVGSDRFALHSAPGAIILIALFIYLFWVVFAEEIRQYASANSELQLEKDRNRVFVEFGRNIAGVVHNLKSVMMSVEGYNDLLKATGMDDWEKILDLQKKSSGRMLEMINNFMVAIRSYQRTEPQEVRLNQLVSGATEVLKGNDVLKHKLRIHLELNEPDIVKAVPMKIMQVIDNVVTNAAESMLGTDRFDLYIRTRPVNGEICLQVEDQGVGIEFCRRCKKHDCMRCKNFSIGKSSKENGSGIGMIYVREIMKELQGNMVIETQLDRGTTVALFFPASENSGQGAGAPPSAIGG